MSRTFYVDGYRDVLMHVTQSVTWEVEADNFEEAELKIKRGEGYVYDVDDYTHDVLDSCYEDRGGIDVDEVRCSSCDYTESDCDCERDDDEDEDADRPGTGPGDLREGQWVVAADDDRSRDMFPETDEPVRIKAVSGLDCDGEHKVYFERVDGVEDYWYVRRSCRFQIVDAPDDEELAEARAERERIREDLRRRRREQEGVNLLLNV